MGFLPQIKDATAYLANVGFINVGEGSTSIEVRIYAPNVGDQFGDGTLMRCWYSSTSSP